MPFAKGRVSNPRGGPRSYERWTDIYAALLAAPPDAPPPPDLTAKEAIARGVVGKALKGDLAAVHVLMERTEGKVRDVADLRVSGAVELVPWGPKPKPEPEPAADAEARRAEA